MFLAYDAINSACTTYSLTKPQRVTSSAAGHGYFYARPQHDDCHLDRAVDFYQLARNDYKHHQCHERLFHHRWRYNDYDRRNNDLHYHGYDDNDLHDSEGAEGSF